MLGTKLIAVKSNDSQKFKPMSLPTYVFLDTSILAGQQYNFDSAALASFIPVAQKAKLTLLLPDPTEREMRRQIDDRSNEALVALEEARRKAPFLAKWSHFPTKVSESIANWEVRRIARREFAAFIAQFDVRRLTYEGLDLTEVMEWYDKVIPPFREGKKRKEFPDAFAIAMLSRFASDSASVVAVVSDDQDFKLACARYPSLLYFRSLPSLTETLLAQPTKIDELRAAFLSEINLLESEISKSAVELSVVHVDSNYEVQDTNVLGARVSDLRIVAFGSGECTLTFESEVETENCLHWSEWDADHDEAISEKQWVIESSPITGLAKVQINSETSKINSVTSLALDQDFVELQENPRRRW